MNWSIHSVTSLVCILFFLGLAPPVRARAETSKVKAVGYDLSPFDIPVVPVPDDGGFGATLEDACKQAVGKSLVVPEQSAVPVLRGKNLGSALKPQPITPAVVDGLRGAVSRLREICTAIASNQLSDTDLDDLRQLQDSGGLPALARGMAAQESTIDANALATSMQEGWSKLASDGTSSLLSLSGFQGKSLDGLAEFLVTRSKEDAILYLQDRFTKETCAGDGEKLLPNLCAAIQGLDPAMSIAAIGAALNTAAKRDLLFLPDGLLRLMEMAEQEHFFLPEVLRLFYAIGLEVVEGRVPREVVLSAHALPLRKCETVPKPPHDSPDRRCQTAFAIPRLGSALLYAAAWNKLERYTTTAAAHRPRIVGALLDAESQYSKPFQTDTTDAAIRKIQFSAGQMNALGRILVAAGEILGRWQKPSLALANVTDPKSTTSDRKRLLATTLFDALTSASQLARQVLPLLVADARERERAGKMLTVVRDIAVVGRDLVNEAYGALPLDASLLADDCKKSLGSEVPKAKGTTWKHISIVVEIASAQSSADVATVLQTAAAPVGSFRTKYRHCQVSLNGLVGGLLAKERLSKPSDPALGKIKESWAVAGFAPVGAEATIPVRVLWDFYLGLMASVIDIGALTTTRIKSEVTNEPKVTSSTNVTFAQVFSPGAYLLVGLFGSPIVLGAGISYAPNLRSLEATSNGTVMAKEKVSSLRYGVFLAADVSILQF